MAAYIRKIFFWVKCHIFNAHSYIKNNEGLSEGLTDIINYYKCVHCEGFNITSKFNSQLNNISDWGFNRILKQKQAYNMCLETREVLVEKYIDLRIESESHFIRRKEKDKKRQIQLLLNELDRI